MIRVNVGKWRDGSLVPRPSRGTRFACGPGNEARGMVTVWAGDDGIRAKSISEVRFRSLLSMVSPGNFGHRVFPVT